MPLGNLAPCQLVVVRLAVHCERTRGQGDEELQMGVKPVKGQMTGQQRQSLKGAHRIEQYKLSPSVILLPERKFAPIDTIERLQVRAALLPGTGCCGMSLPVYNAVVFFSDAPPAKLMFEKKENALRFCKLLASEHKDITLEEYAPPYGEGAN